MASITIRNLEEPIKARLRLLAAQHGRSMEAEVRQILIQAVTQTPAVNLAEKIHQRFAALGVEALPIPARQPVRKPPELEP